MKQIIKHLLSWTIGIGAVAGSARATLAAERLQFNYGILGFSLTVDSLELYAKEGKINRELGFYAQFLDEQTLKQFRRILRRQINIDPILLYRLTRSPRKNRRSYRR